ncbi:MAG: FecR domain-containing protein [Candidatus Wallbacteria bacterium]|nr:FecR domain-containing protein [Candidatus Wallbacteria bacterium]
MPCERFRPFLEQRATGPANGAEAAAGEFDAHLAVCESCSADLEGLSAVVARLSADVSVEPPDVMTQRVMTRVRAAARRQAADGLPRWMPGPPARASAGGLWRFLLGLAVGVAATVAFWPAPSRFEAPATTRAETVVAKAPAPLPQGTSATLAPRGPLQLSDAGSADWRPVSAPAATLTAGGRLRTAGTGAQLTLPDRTTIEISAAAELSYLGTAELLLSRGRVEVHARAPVSLRTPHVLASVLGTRFTVETSADSGTLVRVQEGKVAVLDLATRDSRVLTAGEELHAGPTASPQTEVRPPAPSSPAGAPGPSSVKTLRDGF